MAWEDQSHTRRENTMTVNNYTEYKDKTARNPPGEVVRDVDCFFHGSTVTKEVSAFSIAQIAQDILRALIR